MRLEKLILFYSNDLSLPMFIHQRLKKCLNIYYIHFKHFAYCVILHAFFHLLIFFFKINFFENFFHNTVSNSLDPDQTLHFVGPDLGPNCL